MFRAGVGDFVCEIVVCEILCVNGTQRERPCLINDKDLKSVVQFAA